MTAFSRQTVSSMAKLITRGITPKYANPDVRDSIKVVNQRCIRDGVINFALARVHDLSYRKVSESKILKPGDTLVNSTGVGTLGRTAYFSSGVGDFTADSHVTIVRPRPGVEPRWLAYTLKFLEPDIEFLAEGSTGQTELSRDRLGQLPVDAPPKLTQRAIAATLGALDDKIESNNKLSALAEELLDSLFQQYFPSAYSSLTDESVWRLVGRADDFFTIGIGKTPPRKEHQWFSTDERDIVWASISDLGSQGSFITHSSEYLKPEAVKKFNVRIVPKGSILVSFKLTVGRVAIADSDLTTNEAIAHFVTQNNKIIPYAYVYLKNFDYESLGSTSSIGRAVNSRVIKSMPMRIPGEQHLDVFNEAALPLLKLLKRATYQNLTLAALRDTLLPELMAGRIRVPEAREVVQEATDTELPGVENG